MMQKEDILKTGEMHPELKAFIDVNGTAPRVFELQPIRDYMKFLEKKAIDANPSSAEGVTIDNVTIKARDGYDIPVRTYKPEKPSPDGCPLIVAIHGGGWTVGSADIEEIHCRDFVRAFGAVCVNIDYRLAPEYAFPYAVNDCWDVVQYLSQNASSMLPADPRKGFVITGSSAGGNLSDIMVHLSRDNNLSPPVTGVLEIVPYLCHPDHIPDKYKHLHLSWEQNADVPTGMTREAADWLTAFYEPERGSTLFSPLLDPKKHVGLPPVFLQAHGMDPLRDHAVIYHEALKEAGVESRLKVYAGLPHNFNVFFLDFEATKQHEKDTLDGMAWLLGLEN